VHANLDGGGEVVAIRKVVLCDDDPDIRAIGEMSLRDVGGWDVVCVNDGYAALEAARAERPDLILLDIMMPRLDGPGTFEKLRLDPQCSEIPVVFMTAKAQSHELRGYTELGAAGVIAKPFDPITLPDEIRALLGVG
jgi:CheY-like chemotaxis protein